jgi:hypothetical protein
VLTFVAAGDALITELRVEPAPRAIVSWNGSAPADTLELIVDTLAGHRSRALPYVVFEPGARASLNGFDTVAKIETDVVSADGNIAAIHVTSHHPLTHVAASTASADARRATAAPLPAAVRALPVPQQSQYLAGFPNERGWCAPAALTMLLGAHGVDVALPDVAAGLFDRSYNGTGNWTFAIAFAAARGLAGAAAYLRDLVTVEGFIAAGLPLALSIAWSEGTLPGAPLAESNGHIVVVRGFDAAGNAIVNDPAQPHVRHVYDRTAFANCWLDHGGVALLVAPPDRLTDLVRCANA